MQPSDEPRKQGRHELTVPPSMIRTNRPSHTEPRRGRRIAAPSRIGGDPEWARHRGFPPAGVVGRRCARGPDVTPVMGRSVRGQARGRPVLSADGFSSLSTASTAWTAYPGRLVAGHAPEQRPLARPTTGAAGPAAAPAPHGPDPATTAMSRTASHGSCAPERRGPVDAVPNRFRHWRRGGVQGRVLAPAETPALAEARGSAAPVRKEGTRTLDGWRSRRGRSAARGLRRAPREGSRGRSGRARGAMVDGSRRGPDRLVEGEGGRRQGAAEVSTGPSAADCGSGRGRRGAFPATTSRRGPWLASE